MGMFRFEPGILIGLIAAVLFFAGSGLVTYINTQNISVANQKIVETHRAIVSLKNLLLHLQDAETGQRGYLLTGEDDYLGPYLNARGAIASEFEKVAERTRDNVGQSDRLGILKQRIEAKLDEMAQTIDLRKTQGLSAALDLVSSDRGKVEMDAIRGMVDAMSQTENEVRTSRLAEMESAQQQALISTVLTAALGILLTVVIGYLLGKAAISRSREEWLQTGKIGLGSAMMGDQRIDELGENVLDYLVAYTGAVAGAFFSGARGHFRRTAVYGIPDSKSVPLEFVGREGLLGQASTQGSLIVLDDVPNGYLSFGSALGQDKPKYLVILPAAVEGSTNAVLEMGFLKPVDEKILSLLKQASQAIGLSVQAASYRGELQNLLEETQQQSEELQAQGEELRVNNEELEEQSRVLKESQLRLELQAAELEQTNTQLEEQANQLEIQRSDLERANASVQLKAAELERSSQYKSDFLANMSHELRTPLNSSLILAKLLADNPHENLTEEQVKYARTIQSSGNDLLNLINDILDLSKIEAGHVEIQPEEASVVRLTNGLRQMFEPVASEKQLEFIISLDEHMPKTFETDPRRLEQILKNLISNAIKFTERVKWSYQSDRKAPTRLCFRLPTVVSVLPKISSTAFLRRFIRLIAQSAGDLAARVWAFRFRGSLCDFLQELSQSRVSPGRAAAFRLRCPYGRYLPETFLQPLHPFCRPGALVRCLRWCQRRLLPANFQMIAMRLVETSGYSSSLKTMRHLQRLSVISPGKWDFIVLSRAPQRRLSKPRVNFRQTRSYSMLDCPISRDFQYWTA